VAAGRIEYHSMRTMTEADPKQLKELLALLTDRKLSDVEAAPIVDRALLALDDPTAYINDYPDDEWITEGFALDESSEGSIRLLHWIIFDELQSWLTISDKADELTVSIVDRLIEDGLEVDDPPSRLRTLAEHLHYLNEQLAAIAGAPKELVRFETGFTDEIGLFVVSRNDVARIVALGRAYKLRIQTIPK
jgi:hypothetical protein